MQNTQNTNSSRVENISLLDLIITPLQYEVSRNGETIAVPKLSFDLLMFFVNNPQQILSIEQISAQVWAQKTVSAETITQRIKLLRKALNDDPKNPRYIASVRGRGYKLIGDPQIKSIPAPAPIKPNKNPLLYKLIVSGSLICALVLVLVFYKGGEKNIDFPSDLKLKRANHYLQIGQKDNIEHAISLFRQVLTENSKNEQALIGLSFALSQSVCRYNQVNKNALEAKTIAASAISINPKNSQSETALAYAWDCLGNLENALKHYLRAIELDGTNAKSIGSAAHLLQIKGQLLKSLEMSKLASELNANSPIAKLQIARSLELLNYTTQAQTQYQELFNLYPDNVFINEALPRFLFYQNRFTDAKLHFEKAIKRGESRDSFYLIYSELKWLIEDKGQAILLVERALKHNPENTFAMTVLNILNKNMTIKQAHSKIENLNELVRQGNTWPMHYLEAAIISLWVVQNSNQALEYLQMSVELGFLDSEYLAISPFFAELNTHPQFYQLIDQINNRRIALKLRYESEQGQALPKTSL